MEASQMQISVVIIVLTIFAVIMILEAQNRSQKGKNPAWYSATINRLNNSRSDGLECKNDPAKVISKLQDYFLEKTWGSDGVKWRINNVDPARKRIVADFQCAEFKDELVCFSGISGAFLDGHLVENSSLALSSAKKRLPRYVQVTIQVSSKADGNTAKFDWEFRFPENEKNPRARIPVSILRVCDHLLDHFDNVNT